MANTPFDPMAFKAQQREQWSNAAQGWRRQWRMFERGAQPLSDRMMELAHVTPGQRVLDVATGIGEPAMTAARRVGANGSVVAIDQAPEMLSVARERMLAANITNVEFVEGDAETVALPPASFDAMVCRWGVIFFTEPVGTLARLRTSLIPRGWAAIAVWGPPQRVPIIALPFSVLTYQLDEPPPPPRGPNPFALSEPAALEQAMRAAGFTEVRSEPVTVTFVFASVDELRGYLRDVSAPVRAALARRSPEGQAEFWDKLATAAGAFAGDGAVLRLPNDCLLAAGRRE